MLIRVEIPPLPVWCFDVEARPGPWGGGDFTWRSMLSIAAGFEGKPVAYLAPGFLKMELERLIYPIRHNSVLVVGHNAVRYDLPLLAGTLVKLGLEPLTRPILVQDTYLHTLKSGLAYSKSLANMAQRFGISSKGHMSEVDWEQVYEGNPEALARLKAYNIQDVKVTLALRRVLLERGLLKPPRVWKP